MKASGFITGDYMRGSDFGSNDELVLVIEGVTAEKMGRGRDAEQKLVVSFKDESKALALNKTNLGKLLDALGDETDEWVGHHVTIRVVETQFQGEDVLGLRIVDVDDGEAKKEKKRPGRDKPPF